LRCAVRTLLSTSDDAWKRFAADGKRLLVSDLTGDAAKVAAAFPHIFWGDGLTRGSEAGLKIIQVKQVPPFVTCALHSNCSPPCVQEKHDADPQLVEDAQADSEDDDSD